MQHHFGHHATKRSKFYNASILIGTFILGYLIGANIAFNNLTLYADLIREAFGAPRSITVTLAYIFTLFSLTTILVVMDEKRWLIPICLFQSIFHGTVISAIAFMFIPSHWLIALLLTFSSIVSQISLVCFWLRCTVYLQDAKCELAISFIFSILGAIIDVYIISPLTVTISV